MTEEHINDESFKVAQAMIRLGGGFFSHLGEALVRADRSNTLIIKNAWPEEWKRYRKYYDTVLNRDDSVDAEDEE